MRERFLGDTGIAVSTIGLGTSTWGHSTDQTDAEKQLRAFVRAGGTLLDTASIYGGGRSEEIIGAMLGKVVSRSEVVLATKAGLVGGYPYKADASPGSLLAELDQSLKRLGTDHVDLWQLHTWDDNTPVEETMSTLDDAVASGRARAVGVCNFSGWQTANAATTIRLHTGSLLSSTQVEYSLVQRGIEREVVPAIKKFGMSLLPWAPLGRGVLTGKYRNGPPAGMRRGSLYRWYVEPLVQSTRIQEIVEATTACAAHLGILPAVLALSWVRDRPAVTSALVGARTYEQLEQSLAATDFTLPHDIRTHLDQLSRPHVGYPERPL